MKKILLILLICAYAVSTMGVGFGEFYCCGKLKSTFIALANINKNKCTKEGCCKTKYQFFKLKDNHLVSSDIYLPIKYLAAVHGYTPAVAALSFTQQTTTIHRSHAPPLYNNTLLYLSNCVLRI